jgi:hypothetical protein
MELKSEEKLLLRLGDFKKQSADNKLLTKIKRLKYKTKYNVLKEVLIRRVNKCRLTAWRTNKQKINKKKKKTSKSKFPHQHSHRGTREA